MTTDSWRGKMEAWLRLGEWAVVAVERIESRSGTCALCGKTELSEYWHVRLADETSSAVYRIGNHCGPYLTRMSRDWESRVKVREEFRKDKSLRAAFEQLAKPTKKRVEAMVLLHQHREVVDFEQVHAELSKTSPSIDVDFLIKRLKLIGRIKLLQRPDAFILDLLRKLVENAPEMYEKYRWLNWVGLNVSNREPPKHRRR